MWRRVAHDTLIFSLGGFVLLPLQAAFRLLAMQSLDVADYGRAALLISVFNVVLLVAHFGIPVLASRLSARLDDARGGRSLLEALARASLAPSTIAGLCLAVVTYAVLGSLGSAAIAAAGTVALAVAFVGMGFLRGTGRAWAAASIQPVNCAVQLVVLAILVLTGRADSPDAVLLAYYVGNVGALVMVFALLLPVLHRGGVSKLDGEAGTAQILGYSAVYTLSAVCFAAINVAPRVWLADVSYVQVAFLDLALLVYTLWQRPAAALFSALLPAAVVHRRHGRGAAMPGLGNAGVMLATVAVIAVGLSFTPWLEDLLGLLGLDTYAPAAVLVLILLLAAPSDLLAAMTSGYLTAFGLVRRIAIVGLVVAVAQSGLAFAIRTDDPRWYAALVVLGSWSFYLGSRRYLGEAGVAERDLLRIGWARATRWRRPERVPA